MYSLLSGNVLIKIPRARAIFYPLFSADIIVVVRRNVNSIKHGTNAPAANACILASKRNRAAPRYILPLVRSDRSAVDLPSTLGRYPLAGR